MSLPLHAPKAVRPFSQAGIDSLERLTAALSQTPKMPSPLPLSQSITEHSLESRLESRTLKDRAVSVSDVITTEVFDLASVEEQQKIDHLKSIIPQITENLDRDTFQPKIDELNQLLTRSQITKYSDLRGRILRTLDKIPSTDLCNLIFDTQLLDTANEILISSLSGRFYSRRSSSETSEDIDTMIQVVWDCSEALAQNGPVSQSIKLALTIPRNLLSEEGDRIRDLLLKKLSKIFIVSKKKVEAVNFAKTLSPLDKLTVLENFAITLSTYDDIPVDRIHGVILLVEGMGASDMGNQAEICAKIIKSLRNNGKDIKANCFMNKFPNKDVKQHVNHLFYYGFA